MSFSSLVFVFLVCFEAKNQKYRTRRPKQLTKNPMTYTTHHGPLYPNCCCFHPPPPPHMRTCRRGNRIMVGTVVKEEVGELEEDIREIFSRRLRKEMSGVVQEVVGKRRYLVRFQDRGEKEMLLNQLSIVVFRSEVEEEIEVREVEMIPEVGEELREVEMIPEVGDELEDGVEKW